MPPLTIKGCDSSAPVTARSLPVDLRFVGRYLDNGRNPEHLSTSEVQAYTALGVYVLSIWELAADAVSGGLPAGRSDGEKAVTAMQALGAPPGASVTGTCDEDPRVLHEGPGGTLGYFRGFSSEVRGAGYVSMGYLGAAAANICLAAGAIDLVWIPAAADWADGATPDRVDVSQSVDQAVVGQVEVDLDEAATTAGMWNNRGLAYPTQPIPEATLLLLLCSDAPNGTSKAQLTDGFYRRGLSPGETAKWNSLLSPLGQVKSGAFWAAVEQLPPAPASVSSPAPVPAASLRLALTGTATPSD